MNKIKVSPKEVEILNILWGSEKPLTAKQIYESNQKLVLSTIQATLKKLTAKELVKVDDIIYSGTVLTRSYAPNINKEEFILKQYDNLKIPNLLALFLGNQSKNEMLAEIEEIEKLLEEKRKDL
ncbi:conserved hypothetical protein [Carnobacterium maltaromaticum]|uniref:BlaI/MecI/CopY family transcriptional regulator n=1 Tax=Carnobacterium maltaromaticum TaxID=2751 RepID=UPI00191BA716|nr:BlaI/MecI/CopY family transcriptional regulator [Carnobacterium maltaromaticum]CAD5902056.1 conserved hypothetical protein [Carnobacterium maltaromaticum]